MTPTEDVRVTPQAVTTQAWRGFASDNYAGICPEAWRAMELANAGSANAYGDDDWTQQASDAFRKLFDTQCEVFFAFNGTAANSLALASLCQSYHSVICSAQAHVETDECGAPEFFSNGSKLLVAPTTSGKLDPHAIRKLATSRVMISFFNDVDVTRDDPRVPSAQYFATKGFFPSYDASLDEPLTEAVKAAWLEGFEKLKQGSLEPMQLAQTIHAAEALDSPVTRQGRGDFLDPLWSTVNARP